MPEESIDSNKNNYVLAALVLFVIYVLAKPLLMGWKKASVQCAEKGCSLDAKGYDIETCYDAEDQPVYAVYYECAKGHKFIAEYERNYIEEPVS